MTRLSARLLLAAATVTLPTIPAAAADRTLPTCTLKIGDASPAGFDQFKGKVLYVDFWASWCVPCLLSFPFMNDLQAADGARGLQIVAVNMDEKPADAVTFLGKHPASFPVAVGPNGDCAKAFGVAAMPTSFLVDRDGTIRAVHPGFRPDDVAPLRAEIEAMLSAKAVQ